MGKKRTSACEDERRVRASCVERRRDVTVVIDAGGGTVKYGVAEDGATACATAPHGVAKGKRTLGNKTSVLDEILTIDDVNGLVVRRPIDRGYVVNWELEREVFARACEALNVDATACDLVITEPAHALWATKIALDELVFDDFGFRRVVVATPAMLAKRAADCAAGAKEATTLARCGVVVDCGFSFAHATAIWEGRTVVHGVRRLNLGGKSLTNFLKELVSYRQWNMMDESVVIEDAKEKVCYVADDVMEELKKCKVKRGCEVTREYVLPDGIHVLRGYVRDTVGATKASATRETDDGESDDDDDDDDDEDFGAKGQKKKRAKAPEPKKPKMSDPTEVEHQFLTLTNERFMVPEALFRPSDIGLQQCGVPELVTQAVEIEELADTQRALCYLDVILVGGCTLFPNFVERFERELRSLVSQRNMIRVRRLEDPIKAAWLGGLDLALDRKFYLANALTREEYMANKNAIRESHQSFEITPSTRTGRLLEYAAEPEMPSAEHIAAEAARLTPRVV